MRLIKKLFIKDYKNVADAAVRVRYGVVSGVFGVVSNLILFAFKLAAGMLGGSITIVADAVNNLSDAGSSVVTVIGFKLAKRPADKEHPYGHARYEYITGLLVAIIVFAIGVLLAKSSIEKIILPAVVTVDAFTYAVLGVSVAAKVFQMLLYNNFGKAIRSDALRAAGTDSRNDIIATGAVIISAIIISATGVNVDAYFGLGVSLFILISAIKLIKDTINPLIGTTPDKEFVTKIKDKLLSYDGVLGIHDLMVHSYGEGCIFAIVHVEVDARVDIMISHDLTDNIERDFEDELGIKLSIHMDPIETDNEAVSLQKEQVMAALTALDSRLDMHDFRVVNGVSHINILFDVVLPYDSKLSLPQIEQAVRAALPQTKQKTYLIIGLDRGGI